MEILKTAVVGLGRIGWRVHIPEILAKPDRFTLVAVVDVSQERLEEAKAAYGVNGYNDISAMVAAEKPDLVVIASPTHLHCEHACTAMQLGCDVFLDKPMAQDYETACEIARCAQQTGRKLMVFQPHRAFAGTNQAMELIATGKIGQLKSIRIVNMNYIRRDDWQAFKKFGGGMLNNYGAHFIDKALYMLKDKVNKVYCFTDTVATMGDADDVARILMRTEKGIRIDVDINQAAALTDNDFVAYGTCGAICSEVSEEGVRQFRLRYYDPNAIPKPAASEHLAAANRQYSNDVELPWVEEVIAEDAGYAIDFYGKVYDYFGKGEEPFVPVEQTIYLMRILKHCRMIAETDSDFS